MRFGEKLRQLRTQKNISQASLADALGVTRRTYISYERDGRYPRSAKTYDLLAKILGCTTDDLISEDDKFVLDAKKEYGSRGKKQAEELVAQAKRLFAGGDLSEDDKEAVLKALQNAYWIAKEKNKKIYTPKIYQ